MLRPPALQMIVALPGHVELVRRPKVSAGPGRGVTRSRRFNIHLAVETARAWPKCASHRDLSARSCRTVPEHTLIPATLNQDRFDTAHALLTDLDTLQECVPGLIEVCARIDAGLRRFNIAQAAAQAGAHEAGPDQTPATSRVRRRLVDPDIHAHDAALEANG